MSLTEAMVEVLVIFSRTFAPKTDPELSELVVIWLSAIEDIEAVTPDAIRQAGKVVLQTVDAYWPRPAHLREALIPIAREERARRFSLQFAPPALPPPPMVPLTQARKAEIDARLSTGARQMLSLVVASDDPRIPKRIVE